MPNAKNKEELLRQNLQDSGCSEELTEACMRCYSKGTLKDKLPELSAHRQAVLRETRKKQKQIDCLDYLTNQIRTKNMNEVMEWNIGNSPMETSRSV